MVWSTHEWVYGEGGVLIAKIKSMGGITASLDLRHILDVIFAINIKCHLMKFYISASGTGLILKLLS